MRLPETPKFTNFEKGSQDKSFKHQGKTSVISLAHEGRDLRGRDFKNRMKERQVKK